jgi:Domain of unknown function (DUF5615)
MLPVLIDEGLPYSIAAAMRAVGLDAWAVGDDGAPPSGSTDRANIDWCAERGVVLVTNDLGRKDRAIVEHLASRHVHAVLVYRDLRAAEPHKLLRALLCAEEELERIAGLTQGLIHHRIKPSGRLEKR